MKNALKILQRFKRRFKNLAKNFDIKAIEENNKKYYLNGSHVYYDRKFIEYENRRRNNQATNDKTGL